MIDLDLSSPLCEFTNKHIKFMKPVVCISRGAEGPGREILQRPPSVRSSVRLSVRHI